MTIQGVKTLALIPARGGSKGVLRKNMREVCGVPLIKYTIDAAKGSKYIDDVYVSSDDEVTLEYAKKHDFYPVKRPDCYSTDVASANKVVEHFIDRLSKKEREENPFIIYLQPTSPLRRKEHIDDAVFEMLQSKEEKIISVIEMYKSPYKAFLLDNNKIETLFEEDMTNMRRQDLPAVYYPNGAIYVFRYCDFIERGAFPTNGSLAYVMDNNDSLDVDTEDDIKLLEWMLSR